ncbi:hypothetical protein OPIT5_00045 (plasmid) [Opitutaceae bacterium TAV5]|nr:hypothetical protein OPIT5_00045 [Opitutaceae bacterium TAV5]
MSSEKPKTSSRRWGNPFKKVSVRAQIIILAVILFFALLISMNGGNRKQKGPQEPAEPAGESAGAEKKNEALPQRLPSAVPSEEEMATLARKKAVSLDDQGRDGLKREVPDAIVAMSEPSGEEPENDDGPKPAGVPYSPRRRSNTAVEVFGIMSPPKSGEGEVTQVSRSGIVTAAKDAAKSLEVSGLSTFAPYGRLVKCKMVNTLDSLVPANTPVIGLVVEEVTWNGKVIIPANTEVFSYVNGEPKIDASGVGRLFDTGEWVLVLPKQSGAAAGRNGREWRIKGRALDRRELLVEDRGRVRSWGLDDMALGFIGYTISTLDNEEIKLFATAFLGASAAALGETLQEQEAVPGQDTGLTQPKPTLKNAALSAFGSGIANVMTTSAQRIAEEIARRGFYVRVPSGKDFYLFIEETLDPTRAEVGLKLSRSEPSGENR